MAKGFGGMGGMNTVSYTHLDVYKRQISYGDNKFNYLQKIYRSVCMMQMCIRDRYLTGSMKMKKQ